MKKLVLVVLLLVALAAPVRSAEPPIFRAHALKRVAVITSPASTQPFYVDPGKVAWVYYDDQLAKWTIRLSWAGTRIPTTMTREELFRQLGWRITQPEAETETPEEKD